MRNLSSKQGPMPIPPRRHVGRTRPAHRPISNIDAATEAEIVEQHLAHGDELEADVYPALNNLSGAFIYRFMLRPVEARPIEYIRVSLHRPEPAASDAEVNAYHAVANFIA